MMYNHFIITRFNLRKSEWTIDKNSEVILEDQWLLERNELFKNYCLPSILNQTSKKFKWLIFFQKGTEADVSSIISILEAYSFIELIFMDGYDEFQNKLSTLIKERMDSDSIKVLTTRLDNDDALHEMFICDLQRSIELVPSDTILQFPYGICLKQGRIRKIALQYYPLNQFLTLLEHYNPTQDPLTILGREHTVWKKEGYNIYNVTKEPRWLQVVHERNLVNVYQGIPIFSKHIRGFNLNKIQIGWLNNIIVVCQKLANFKKTITPKL